MEALGLKSSYSIQIMLKTIIFLMLIVHCSTEEDMTLSNAQIDFKEFHTPQALRLS